MYVTLSGWNSVRICDTTRKQLSILYTDVSHFFLIFIEYEQSGWSSSIIDACTIILALTYLSITGEESCIFHEKYIGLQFIFVYSFIRQLYWRCDIRDCSRVPPERAAYKKLRNFERSKLSDYPNLLKLLLFGFWNNFHSPNLQ